jgi:hypothetical protein
MSTTIADDCRYCNSAVALHLGKESHEQRMATLPQVEAVLSHASLAAGSVAHRLGVSVDELGPHLLHQRRVKVGSEIGRASCRERV